MSEQTSQQVTGARLTKRQIAAYHRVLGDSQEVAAQHACVSREMVGRWERRGDPAYWDAFEQGRRELLRTGWAEAWLVLRRALKSDDKNVAIRAASKIVDAVSREYPTRLEHSGSITTESPFEVVVCRPELPPDDHVTER